MLGLGLAVTVGKRILGGVIESLMSALRGRAEYSENNTDSKAVVKDIDNYELLDKATILLTPTATSNARVHSVKTYTGDELLNVSSLSGTNWTADGSGGFTNNGSGGGLYGSLNVSTVVGATYRLTFDVTISGVANATFGGVTIPVFTTSGSKEYYVTATSSSTNFDFYLATSGSPSMFVNNISVTDVSSDFDFDRASSATRINSSGLVQDMQSITDPELVTDGDFALTGTQAASTTGTYWTTADSWTISNNKASYDGTTNGSILEQAIDLDNGNTYEVTLTISDNSGRFRLSIDSGTADYNTYTTGNGTYKFYFVADADEVQIRGSLSDSAATFSLSDISVKEVTFSDDVDLARINYDSNGENGHILLEPTSTNLVTYSEDFSDSSWSKQSNITPTYNTTETLSPDGTYNATKFVGNGSDGVFVQASVTGVITRSVYLKSVTGTTNVVLKDPVLTQTAKTLTLNETWQRYDLSESNQHGSLSGLWIDDIPSSGIYMWGTQIEALPYATSYIPSLTGSTVTRATETLTGSGNSTLINSTEGVLYAEIAALDDDGTDRKISLNDGTYDNQIVVGFSRFSGNINAEVFYDGDLQSSGWGATSVTQNNFNKFALSWQNGNYKFFYNGVKTSDQSISNTPIGLSQVKFSYGNNTQPMFCECKALAVFNEALTDDELELLTGVTNYPSFGALAAAGGYTII